MEMAAVLAVVVEVVVVVEVETQYKNKSGSFCCVLNSPNSQHHHQQ